MERHGYNTDVIKVQTAAEHLPTVQEGLCTSDLQYQKGAVHTGVHTINSCVTRVKNGLRKYSQLFYTKCINFKKIATATQRLRLPLVLRSPLQLLL